ncbi:hypothetical protein GCM10022252_69170 [Streptosporangium oxazolinicum]|uniref:Uncharacterized protein n=1 Tax=Streptosporangium oxazolinicum TaxID=909287 RepID=A0ABP8BH48_9ACTN
MAAGGADPEPAESADPVVSAEEQATSAALSRARPNPVRRPVLREIGTVLSLLCSSPAWTIVCTRPPPRRFRPRRAIPVRPCPPPAAYPYSRRFVRAIAQRVK